MNSYYEYGKYTAKTRVDNHSYRPHGNSSNLIALLLSTSTIN